MTRSGMLTTWRENSKVSEILPALDAKPQSNQRQAALNKLWQRKIRIIIGVDLFNEGVDLLIVDLNSRS